MNNSAKIKDRMFRYLEINQISKLKFCEITGISYGNVTGKAQKSEFGGEQITEILLKFPDINPDWLLLEKGEMLREEVKKSEPNSEMNINFYKKIISDLQELIDHQREELLKLQAELTQEREKSVSSSAKIETASI